MSEQLQNEPRQRLAFVLGGTGFVGRKVCQSLLASGYSVFVQTRQKSATPAAGITYVKSITDLPKGAHIDVLINLAGEPIADKRWTDKRKQQLLDSRVSLTRRLLEDCRSREISLDTVIGASAIGFYGVSSEARLSEDSSIGKGFAADLCREWEKAHNAFLSLCSRLVIFRLGVVIGEGGALAKLLPVFRFGLGGPIGSGDQWFSWVAMQDVVSAFDYVLKEPSCTGVYNLVAPNVVSQKTFAVSLGKVLHRPAVLPMPACVCHMLFGQMAQELLLGGQSVYPARLERAGFTFTMPTLEQALHESIMS